MAKSSPGSEKNTANKSGRWWRLLIVLLVFGAIVGGCYGFFRGSFHLLFAGNDRFTLRRVEVKSAGFWNDRGDLLAYELGLRLNSDNLFALKPADIRARVGKIANVERCHITRLLPDTLKIVITERIPRARILSPDSKWVIDEHCVVIPRARTMPFAKNLPLVVGLRGANITEGVELAGAKDAMHLLMTVLHNYPELKVDVVSVMVKGKLIFYAQYLAGSPCAVTVPTGISDLNLRLNALIASIQQVRQRRERKSIFDLSFSGQVIAK